MNWKLNFTLGIFFVLAAIIIGRLGFLQILKHEYYQALAEGQQKILETTIGERGRVFFNNGEALAINKTGKYLFLSPREIKNKQETAKAISEILEMDEQMILIRTQKDNLFELIKHDLSDQEISALNELNLKGVYLEEETFRYYPQKDLAAHVIGFLSSDNQGQYGIEGYYDEVLKGEESLQEREKGPFGFLSSNLDRTSGQDLTLTLDPTIQFVANKLLKETQSQLKFDSGQIIVLNPHTGAIIALAQTPGFDPNSYSQVNSVEIFQNSAIQKIFEPGSIFKPITMAAALNEEKITPKTTYEDRGIVKIGGWKILNYDERVWGTQTMTNVLEKSINTGAVFAGQELGQHSFLEYIEKFGFLEKTDIDLQGEVYSKNSELKKGYEINFATAAFGQGIEVTPIQMAMAFSAIANGGKLVQPHILKDQEYESKEIISNKTSSELTGMLVSVTEKGFGKAARIPGYFVAGKTGTAQVAWSALGMNKSGYSDKTVQSFIGYAPAFDPQFLILVKLDDPQAKTAEYSAIPIFQELGKFIIDYWEIAPDHE